MNKCTALLLFSLAMVSWDAAEGSFSKLRRELPHQLAGDCIRVHYATSGPHQVRADDADANGIPDQVEDVFKQAQAAYQWWQEEGFQAPLKSDRYSGVRWIDIHLLAHDTLGSNGKAYDEPRAFGRAGDPAGTRSLCVDVATSIDARHNSTPAHEIFHMFQNAATHFKNSWFTEGTARWSQHPFQPFGSLGKQDSISWPPDRATMEEVFQSAYASFRTYWFPLLRHMEESKPEKAGKEAVPRYSDGSLVQKGPALPGTQFLVQLFTALGEREAQVARERGCESWPEKEQKSPSNNPIIHEVVKHLAQVSE